ncbi:MAG: hypothetical protein HFJ98_05010 [Eubacterium sp.]|nr:hypothetical protein [Eubacterium sp.]
MKTHLKRIGSFLGYTLAFNIISFIFYFLPAFAAHDFYGPVFLIFGIAQICFTILFFNKVPLPKALNEKGLKTDLVLCFIILSVLSIIATIWRVQTDSWLSYIFFNNYFTFTLSADFLDTLGAIIGIYIIENTIKTFLFYTNISKKSLSKPICITLSVIMILTYIVFFFLLIILDM